MLIAIDNIIYMQGCTKGDPKGFRKPLFVNGSWLDQRLKAQDRGTLNRAVTYFNRAVIYSNWAVMIYLFLKLLLATQSP